MVLGGQPPGRVGRRRSFLEPPRRGGSFSLALGCGVGSQFRPAARGAFWARTRPRQKGHNVIGAIILGIIAGYLARLLMPGRQDIGFLLTAVLGIVGALVGFFIFTSVLGIGDNDAFDLGGLPGAVVGAVLGLYPLGGFGGGRQAHGGRR